MAKFPTFPTLFDTVYQLNISKLTEWGYLKPNQLKTGVLNWSSRGVKTASVSIEVNADRKEVFLDYKFNDEPRRVRYKLVCIDSNLGKGKVWYFLCPHTGKRCRILYCVDGYFLHRTAFRGCMYDSQTRSKKWREFDLIYGGYFKSEKLYEQLYKKNFKKTYAGKPTKKYLKLMREIEKADKIDFREIEYFMVNGY